MRIKLIFSKNTEPVENNQKLVNKYIHEKLLKGENYHDGPSNASISRMCGGFVKGRTIDYPNGGFIVISSMDHKFMDKIIMGPLENPDFGFGMKCIDIEYVNETLYGGWNHFKTLETGFLLKRLRDPKKEGLGDNGFITLNDSDLIGELKKQIVRKFSKINSKLNFNDLDINIEKKPHHETRNIYIGKFKNIVNYCQISIHTNRKLAEYIYNHGLGHSTGSGLGVLYKTENHDMYRVSR